LYVIDPSQAYKRLSGGGLTLAQQYTLQALAEWREAQAQKRDIPRTWVIRDDSLFDLAVKRPSNAQAIKDLQVFGRKSANYLAPQAAEIIAHVSVGDKPLWRRVDPLDKEAKKVCSAMMKMLAGFAKEFHVAQGLLGTRRDIEALFRFRTSEKLLTGWRKNLVGEKLLAFLDSQG
jgi:ribonuclease D